MTIHGPHQRDAALDHALALLENVPLVDGHNDLPWTIRTSRLARGDVIAYDLTRVHERADTDIPRLKEGRVSAQIWAAFIPSKTQQPARAALELIDVILRIEEAHPDVFLPARRSSDIERAKRAGKIASIIGIEGGVGLENSLSPLRVWHAAGARLMTLCHNETLDWIDSATDEKRHGGLTAFGRAVVRELNRLGMFVDCAHVSHDVMRQVLDISAAPIVMSHSNAFALCDHPRNVPDDVLARLKANGGLVMATFVPDFISRATRNWDRPLRDTHGKAPEGLNVEKAAAERAQAVGPRPPATLQQLADHILYLADKAGIDHIGIGSDFFGGPTPVGLEDVSRFPFLLAELIRRGWSDDSIAKIAGGNFVRAFRAVERASKSLREERPLVGRIDEFADSRASPA
ncbi:MAG: dipeptidase [Methylobacteriaceae bacterium]|nr:dipeptidase [Methylobacteriaceae bacterium]MBV9221980.1 dipeptidase [Methylobacteriaceae bacterium]MBV9636956.1 dipeptidase [Methylobacteriaceae bacterium]MBV9704834.1 dipeptidase [Methylobacteriaceae bacterium]